MLHLTVQEFLTYKGNKTVEGMCKSVIAYRCHELHSEWHDAILSTSFDPKHTLLTANSLEISNRKMLREQRTVKLNFLRL